MAELKMITKEDINAYIAEKYPTWEGDSLVRLQSTLEKLVAFQDKVKRPAHQFSRQDFITLFEKNHWTALNTFVSNKSLLVQFMQWYFEMFDEEIHQQVTLMPIMSKIEFIEFEDIDQDARYEREYYKDFTDFVTTLKAVYNAVPVPGQEADENRYAMDMASWVLMWYGLAREDIREIKKAHAFTKVLGEESQARVWVETKKLEIIISDPDAVKIIHTAKEEDGYSMSWDGKSRPYKYAKTGYLIRSTGKSTGPVSLSIFGKFNNNQEALVRALPDDSPYKKMKKKIVYRGIMNSGSFVRMLNAENNGIALTDGVVADLRLSQPINAAQRKSIDVNYKGWKKHFYGSDSK